MSAKRRSTEPPSIQIKSFTSEEIQQGITKLRRRIEDVRRLQVDGVRHDDQRKTNVEQDIDRTIMEVFGQNSPEYRANIHHSIWHGDMEVVVPFGYERDHQSDFNAGIPRTITMLEGLISSLEEKRLDLQEDPTARVRTAFEGLDLHPRISGVCAELYRDGYYRNAVQDAAIALVNFVKEKSRRHDLDGAGLMTTVFSKKNPILMFNSLKDQTDQDEQEGMMHLFVGAVLAFRNPRSHALKLDTPEQALEYIAFLSLLAKHVEQSSRVAGP